MPRCKTSKYVQFLFHDSQGPWAGALQALAAAIEIAQSRGRNEDAARYAQQGRPLADEARGHQDSRGRLQLLGCSTGQSAMTEAASRAIRRLGRYPGT